MLAILGSEVLDVLVEMSMAILIGWVGWHAGRCLHFPEFGPLAGIAVLSLIQHLTHWPMLQLTMYFLVIIAISLLPLGREWRKRKRLYRLLNLHISGKPMQENGKKRMQRSVNPSKRPFRIRVNRRDMG
jgi:hypothetical protein